MTLCALLFLFVVAEPYLSEITDIFGLEVFFSFSCIVSYFL